MRDIAVRPILATGVAIALVIALVVAAVLIWLRAAAIAPGGDRLDLRETAAGAPGLSSAPQPEMQRERREKEARLHSAGWVDRKAGIAHIPIDDAMDILASRAGAKR